MSGCHTCRFMEVPPDKAGRRVVRADKAYRCLYEVTWPDMPDSITHAHDFQYPSKNWVWKNFGKDCPVWEGLK